VSAIHEEHKSQGPPVVRCAVITISDTRTLADDRGGQLLVDMLTAVTDDDWQIAADIREGGINQFLLKPIEITGMGELIPVPVIITKGPSEESEEGQSRIEIAQHVTDSDEEADIMFYLEPDGQETSATVRLLISIDPPNKTAQDSKPGVLRGGVAINGGLAANTVLNMASLSLFMMRR
jgi:hypothetical protein